MVIERFKDGNAKSVYRRFRESGRMVPDGLAYIDSWVELGRGRCFQLMACEDPALLDRWTARWADLVDFEIVPVRGSTETAEEVFAELDTEAPDRPSGRQL